MEELDKRAPFTAAGGIIPPAFPFAAFKSFYGALGHAGKNRDCFIKKRSFLGVPKKWKAA